MSESKNWLSFIDTAITISEVKLTVGGKLNNKVKAICFAFVSIFFFSLLSCTSNTNEENKTPAIDTAAQETQNDLEGAWELVSTTEQPIANFKKPLQLKLFVDGYFCLIMQDSTRKWSLASGGTYETDGNIYKETHLYTKQPEWAEWVGYTDWQQYEIKGDTLYKKLFTKVVNSKGEDITTQFPSNIEEKRVRAKKSG